MSRIDENQVAVARESGIQLGHQFLVEKLGLSFNVLGQV